MTTPTAPDVYIKEIPVFPPSVAEVETAVPAFIGYTQKADRVADNDLNMKPTKIRSFTDYEHLFGFTPNQTLALTVETDPDGLPLRSTGFTVGGTAPSNDIILDYLMYYSVKHYFANGGGQCYIVSVGLQTATPAIDVDDLLDGLEAVGLEDEPTLIVIPEAVRLSTTEYQSLAQAALQQCAELQDRFAVFDLYHGASDLEAPPTGGTGTTPAAEVDRGLFGNSNLKYGATYYPFLRSAYYYAYDTDGVTVTVNAPGAPGTGASLTSIRDTNTVVYNFVLEEIKKHFVVVPPSGAVVGAYAATDTNRGVWKAPANVSLNDVVEPVVRLNQATQGPLNVDPGTGKSINAIRAFAGKGSLVWGARTLAGNDNEWRYVNVRRFFNMVEESVKKSTYPFVFEPNDANTWVKVRGMIENYLVQKWREGALAGATPRDAFFVRCGLGTTMNSQDILEGRLNVEIGMAVVRPAEFIILKFSHKLQTS